jgi:hypothetical protein
MRKFPCLLFFYGGALALPGVIAKAQAERYSWGRGSIGMEEISASISPNTYVRSKPFVSFDGTFPFGLTTGLGLSYYEIPFADDKIHQTSLSLRLGWQFLEQRLQVLAHADLILSKYSRFSGDIHEGYGADVLYHIPLAASGHLQLEAGVGWSYVPQTHFSRCFFGVGNANDLEACPLPGSTAPQYNYFSLHVGMAWGL